VMMEGVGSKTNMQAPQRFTIEVRHFLADRSGGLVLGERLGLLGLVSEGGLEPPRPIKGTSTSS
jgi:hypothetical protein